MEENLPDFMATISDATNNIPPHIKENFFKALGSLGTALVDIPKAYLEGKAKIQRATDQATADTITAIGNNLNLSVNVPDIYAQKAIEKYASKIIKQQIVMDDILHGSLREITSLNTLNQHSNESISEEWLDHFNNIAKIKSSEEMKIIFSKILANEIINPGSYSLKTLTTFANLDKEIADIFQKLCSIGIGIYNNANEIMFVFTPYCNDHDSHHSLKEFDIYPSELLYLEEYGLAKTIGITYDMKSHIKNVNDNSKEPFTYNNKNYFLKPLQENVEVGNLSVACVPFTHAGAEMYNIITRSENQKHSDSLMNYFASHNLTMIEA